MFGTWARKLSRKAKRFLIVAVGTHGDIFPLLALGERLNSRGHDVSLLAPPAYAQWADDLPGVRFFPLCSPQQYERSLADFYLLNWRYGPLFIQRHTIPWNLALYQVAQSLMDKDLTLLVADRGMVWADSIIRSRFRIPVIRLEIEPRPVWRLNEPKLPWGQVQMNLLARFEREWRDAIGGFDVKQRLGRLSKLRWAGLPSIPRIGLYCDWFARNQGSKSVRKFCFLPPPRLASDGPRAFAKREGRRFIVFMAGTQGTVSGWSRHFFNTSLAICVKHGYSGLLLGGTDPSISGVPDAAVQWQEYVSLSDILPRSDVIVHHGGIGTAAAAIEHGVPQVIIPRFASQPSNAECIKRLGVGTVMQGYSYTEKQGAEQISRMLADREVKKRLQPYIGRCYCEKTLLGLVHFLEYWPDNQAQNRT